MSSNNNINTAPLPPPSAFVSAINAVLAKSSNNNNKIQLSLSNATVPEKGIRRGCCFIDCNSIEEATEIVKICQQQQEEQNAPKFLEDDGVGSFWKNRGDLVVSQKMNNVTEECVNEKTGKKFSKVVDKTPAAAILVSYAEQPQKEQQQQEEAKQQQQQQEPTNKTSTENNNNTDAAAASTTSSSSVPQNQNQNSNASNGNNNNNNNSKNTKPTTSTMKTPTIAPPLYLRCKKLIKIGQVFDFFRSHNIAGHADDCVYCQTKKPYFIVEWGKNTKAYDASLFLDGTSYQGEDVKVMQAQQTAKEVKERKPDVLSLAGNREKKIRQREEEVAEAVNDFLAPISVLMNRSSKNDNNDEKKQPGSNPPPAPE